MLSLGMNSDQKGFTLVEMMVVTGIIALIAAIAIPNLIRAKTNANNTSAQATLKSVSTALENYYAINNAYPPNTGALLTAAPPYLSKDYFAGPYNGFSFTANLSFGGYSYSVLAVPVASTQGTASYTITTGSVLVQNP